MINRTNIMFFSYRIFNPNVPLSQRFLQVSNMVLEALLARQLRLAHVVEFPKCGGSWVRNMIRTYRGTDRFLYNRLIRKNEVIMGHVLYRRRFLHPIIVVRDPRDMYVSFYHHENTYEKRDKKSALFKYFRHNPSRSVQDDFCEYLKVKLTCPTHPWFSFGQFLEAWIDRPDICLVKYEDCLANPHKELVRMLEFLGDQVEESRVQKTVHETSFQAVTKVEYGSGRNPAEQDNTKFHRKGISGDWRNYFDTVSCRLIEQFEGKSLRRLGYESDSNWIQQFFDERQ